MIRAPEISMPAYRIALLLLVSLWLVEPAAAQQSARSLAGGSSAPTDASRNISTGLAAELARQGAPVIDVRTPEELLQTGYIEGATNIPHVELDRIEALIGERKDRAVVLYCRSGRRVSLVIDALGDRGFDRLVNAGGFVDFKAALQAP